MTQITALEKTASDGRKVKITVEWRYNRAVITSYVNGKQQGTDSGVGEMTARQRAKLPPHITHHTAGVGLTTDEAAQVRAAVAQVTPVEATLRAERQALVSEIRALLDEGDYRAEKYHAAGAGDGHEYQIKAEYERQAQAVRARLAEFDAAHPEIVTAIKAEQEAERRESVARHMWD